MFDFIQKDELGLSNIIGMLLDSKAEHGQGSLFLKIFIDIFGNEKLQNLSNKSFEVYKEYSTKENRRIDILLKNSDFAIIIENKPYAGDQLDQINDYIKHFENNENFKNKLFTIYLNKTKDLPTYFSSDTKKDELQQKVDSDELRVISFYEFADSFLYRCYKECESEKFRYFLSDFIDFIKQNFQKNGDNNG